MAVVAVVTGGDIVAVDTVDSVDGGVLSVPPLEGEPLDPAG